MLSLFPSQSRPSDQSIFMYRSESFLYRWGLALVATGIAALVVDRVHLVFLHPALPLLFAVAVATAGWVGGLGPALLSAVLSGAALANHDGNLANPHWADMFRLGCLVFLATAMAWLRRRADQELQRRLELTRDLAHLTENLTVQQRLYGETVQTVQQEKHRASLLRSLAEASLRIHSANSLDSVLREITDQAREIIGAHQAFTTLAPGGNWTQAMHVVSLSKKYSDHPPEGRAWSAYHSFVDNYRRRFEESGNDEKEELKGRSSKWIAAPLVTRDGRNLGVIQVIEKVEGRFSEEDSSILAQLAHVASVAIDNVRLYREAQEQVTARDRAQEALEQSRAALLLAQSAAEIGVFEWDLQTGELAWPGEICTLHGVTPQEFDGKYESWLRAIHADDRDRVQHAVSDAVKTAGQYRVEYRTARSDGNQHWIETRGKVFSAGGRPLRLLGVAMDVTHRKRSEEALRTSEKLAATGRLAASIAHEINNPLAAVTNVLYLLARNPGLNEHAREQVALAEAELQRVIHITRQTLAFYRESSQPTELAVNEIWDDVLRVYAGKIHQSGVQLEKSYFAEGRIRGFAGELRQVFSNLLLNAVEAVSPGGFIRISVREGHSWRDGSMSGVRVTIADNGAGILAENRTRLFEPFFSTKGEKGTGLGLWVTEGIVRKHGGLIRVRSSVSPGRSGTTFSVFLPAQPVATEKPLENGTLEAVA